jgi:hypothetical protein
MARTGPVAMTRGEQGIIEEDFQSADELEIVGRG